MRRPAVAKNSYLEKTLGFPRADAALYPVEIDGRAKHAHLFAEIRVHMCSVPHLPMAVHAPSRALLSEATPSDKPFRRQLPQSCARARTGYGERCGATARVAPKAAWGVFEVPRRPRPLRQTATNNITMAAAVLLRPVMHALTCRCLFGACVVAMEARHDMQFY